MRDKLRSCMKLAHETLYKAQVDMKTWYDKNTKERAFEAGDEVLIFLPTSTRALEAQ